MIYHGLGAHGHGQCLHSIPGRRHTRAPRSTMRRSSARSSRRSTSSATMPVCATLRSWRTSGHQPELWYEPVFHTVENTPPAGVVARDQGSKSLQCYNICLVCLLAGSEAFATEPVSKQTKDMLVTLQTFGIAVPCNDTIRWCVLSGLEHRLVQKLPRQAMQRVNPDLAVKKQILKKALHQVATKMGSSWARPLRDDEIEDRRYGQWGLPPMKASPAQSCPDLRQAKTPSTNPTCTSPPFPYSKAVLKWGASTSGVSAGGLGLAKVRARPCRANRRWG
jgi:hypothetical protein